jgi:hypothetical protein
MRQHVVSLQRNILEFNREKLANLGTLSIDGENGLIKWTGKHPNLAIVRTHMLIVE